MKSFLREVGLTIVLALVIFLALQVTVQHSIVDGSSMEPTLQIDQHLLINKLSYKFGDPQRGDIIVFNPPFKTEKPYIKRVIGLPGESVKIVDGVVFILKGGSEFMLEEQYIKALSPRDYNGGTIPANQYFVLGDNRGNSEDSRYGWLAQRKDIIGEAWMSVWPLGRWGLLTNPLQAQS